MRLPVPHDFDAARGERARGVTVTVTGEGRVSSRSDAALDTAADNPFDDPLDAPARARWPLDPAAEKVSLDERRASGVSAPKVRSAVVPVGDVSVTVLSPSRLRLSLRA